MVTVLEDISNDLILSNGLKIKQAKSEIFRSELSREGILVIANEGRI